MRRRTLLVRMARVGAAALSAALPACRTRVVEVEVERLVPVDRPVTKIVTEVVRETVIVPETPRVVERIVTPAPAPTQPVTLRADVLDYGWTRLARQMSSAFEETFPHLRIVWRSLSDWRDYPERIAVLRASGQLGDLIESPCRTLTVAWAADGVVSDLMPTIEADGYDTGGFFPGALAAHRWEGHQVGLPLLAHGGEHVLLYDQDLFDQLGLGAPDPAEGLAELTETVERIGLARRDVAAHIVSTSLPGAYPLLRAFGTDLLEPGGRHCILDGPGGRELLHWLHRQVHESATAPPAAALERGPVAMWRAGRAATLRTSLRQAVALADLQPERRVGVLPLPAMPGADSAPALLSGVGYCVPATSRRAKEALQWIKFMLTREMGVRLFVEGYAEPGSRMVSWQDARVLDRFSHCSRLAEVVARAEGERVPANLATQACYGLWSDYVGRMLTGELSPDATAARIAAEIDALLGAPERRAGEDG